MPLTPLPIAAPVEPDIGVCSADYGERLNIAECLSAAAQLPMGDSLVSYRVGDELPIDSHVDLIGTVGEPYILPWAAVVGNCMIALEIAGPARPATIALRPDDIRGMTGWVIDDCVRDKGSIGGYITGLLQGMLSFASDPDSNFPRLPYPTSTAFITVTVSSLTGDQEPGDYDIDVPISISEALDQKAETLPDRSSLRRQYISRWLDLHFRALDMASRKKRNQWWNDSTHSSAMTYECNDNLGAPHAADCEALEYSELGISSDTVAIGPGTPKVLKTSLCGVAILAVEPVVLSWEQIKAALDTLMSLCVSNPLASPTGGKAYYSTPAIHKSRRRKKRADSVSGLNALPPHVSLALYQPGKFNP